MSRLPSLSSRKIIKALRSVGFEDAPKRGKGSHNALTKSDPGGTVFLVIVPEGKNIPIGTLQAIIKQAGLTRDEFLSLL